MAQRRLTQNQLFVLSVLLKQRNGREVAEAIQKHMGVDMPFSTVYSALGTLEARGLLSASGPKKGQDGRLRNFRITKRGLAVLERDRLSYRPVTGAQLRRI